MTHGGAPPARILLVALDNLGDLVFASALTPPLRAAFPDAVIDIWCKQYTAPIAALVPHVDSVIAADPFWAVPKHLGRPSVNAFLRSVGVVRQGRYDLAVLSEAPWRTAAAVAAARIPRRIGLARHHNHRFLTDVLPAEDAHKSVVREQARLLAPLGVEPANPRYALDVSRLGDRRAAVGGELPSSFAAFHPFASTRRRCVPLTEWTELATTMRARGLSILWIGTASELEELRASNAHPGDAYVDRLGNGSLTTAAAALSLATVFVGHDSGPLHIAAAFGVPVVGVFAPGQPDRTFPQGIGPWRMIHRPTPSGITSSVILREIDALSLFSTT